MRQANIILSPPSVNLDVTMCESGLSLIFLLPQLIVLAVSLEFRNRGGLREDLAAAPSEGCLDFRRLSDHSGVTCSLPDVGFNFQGSYFCILLSQRLLPCPNICFLIDYRHNPVKLLFLVLLHSWTNFYIDS